LLRNRTENDLIIQDCYETTEEKITQKEHSIFVGVSLGNSFFDKENLENYIRWALQHTRDRIAVFIPDELEAINIHFKDRKSMGRSLSRAKKKGKHVREFVEHIRETVPVEQGELIDILHWEDVGDSEKYRNNQGIIQEVFQEDKGKENGFHSEVQGFVDRFLNNSGKQLSETRKEGLCQYFLEEFSVLVGGLEHCLKSRTHVYELLPYPILDDVQRLIIDIQNNERFPIFKEQLIMNGKLSSIALNYSL